MVCFVRCCPNPYKFSKMYGKRIFHFFVNLFPGSLITDLSNANVGLDESIKNADTYLESKNSVKNDGLDRNVINKIDETQQVSNCIHVICNTIAFQYCCTFLKVRATRLGDFC